MSAPAKHVMWTFATWGVQCPVGLSMKCCVDVEQCQGAETFRKNCCKLSAGVRAVRAFKRINFHVRCGNSPHLLKLLDMTGGEFKFGEERLRRKICISCSSSPPSNGATLERSVFPERDKNCLWGYFFFIFVFPWEESQWVNSTQGIYSPVYMIHVYPARVFLSKLI
jgi:hypothetical protein